MPVQLPPGYHIRNFETLLSSVLKKYADILTAEEQGYAKRYGGLSVQAQSLYVRLICRKGPVFRSDKLNYADVENISASAAELKEAGFLSSKASNEELVGLQTKKELLLWLSLPPEVKNYKRNDLITWIETNRNVEEFSCGFDTFRPLMIEMLMLYRLLFFGNLSQDFSEFVLADMGLTQYESVDIQPDARIFGSREDIEKQLELYDLRDRCETLLDEEQYDQLYLTLSTSPVASHLGEDRPHYRRRRERLLNSIARHLERHEKFENALHLYALSGKSPSRERRVRMLAKMDDSAQALDICRAMLDDPQDEQELEFSARFGEKLARRLGVESFPVKPASALNYSHSTVIVPPPNLTKLRVEIAAKEYVESAGGHCFYTENSLIPGLFGLVFWDVIFADIDGGFVNAFQRGPIDLFTNDFRENRKTLIDKRLWELEHSSEIKEKMMATYHSKYGISNYFVHWNILTEALVEMAVNRIPRQHLAAMFQRMIFDLANNRSGFPDLVYFPSRDENKDYQFIEVKGPGDKLQANQKRWIRFFSQQGIPFRLLNVEWGEQLLGQAEQ